VAEDSALVFPRRDGRPWNDEGWRSWRRRVFAPAAGAAGLEHFRPSDLRHSFVSLLLAEGKRAVEVAKQAGHSPTMTLATYGRVIEELDASEKLSAENLIRRPPSKLVRTTFATPCRATQPRRENPWKTESPLTDSNRRPSPYHGGFALLLCDLGKALGSALSLQSD